MFSVKDNFECNICNCKKTESDKRTGLFCLFEEKKCDSGNHQGYIQFNLINF